MAEKKKDEPVTACPNCGNLLLGWLGNHVEDAAILQIGGPLMGVYKCDRCGYQGLPLEFDNIEAYSEFMRAKKEAEGKAPTEEIETAEKKKEPPMASKMVFGQFKIELLVAVAIVVIFLILLLIAGR